MRGHCTMSGCRCANFVPWRHAWPRQYPGQALPQPEDLDQRCYLCAHRDTTHAEVRKP